MVCKPARPSAALELRGSLHDGPDGTRIGIAHAIYVKGDPLFAGFRLGGDGGCGCWEEACWGVLWVGECGPRALEGLRSRRLALGEGVIGRHRFVVACAELAAGLRGFGC
jgi:hypothetical protein